MKLEAGQQSVLSFKNVLVGVVALDIRASCDDPKNRNTSVREKPWLVWFKVVFGLFFYDKTPGSSSGRSLKSIWLQDTLNFNVVTDFVRSQVFN